MIHMFCIIVQFFFKMYLYYVLCIFFAVPLSGGDNLISNNSTLTSKKLINTTLEKHGNDKLSANKSNIVMLSEGGSILPKKLSMTLPAENHTNLITLDKEIGKTKQKSIVPRKGVVYNPLENSPANNIGSRKDRIDTTLSKANVKDEKYTSTAMDSQINSSVSALNVTANNKQAAISNRSLATSTEQLKPKKPLIVSYEELSELDKNTKPELVTMPKIESSPQTVMSDQLPTPNVKVHTMSTNRHPGMIMPVVITILVVPMFVVLGYMALRRGQEAWKNRHYKRMDFLLDGMYND